MFWRSRWMYSGEPGAGPAAFAVAAATVINAAHAIATASFLTSNISPRSFEVAEETYPAGRDATRIRVVAVSEGGWRRIRRSVSFGACAAFSRSSPPLRPSPQPAPHL